MLLMSYAKVTNRIYMYLILWWTNLNIIGLGQGYWLENTSKQNEVLKGHHRVNLIWTYFIVITKGLGTSSENITPSPYNILNLLIVINICNKCFIFLVCGCKFLQKYMYNKSLRHYFEKFALLYLSDQSTLLLRNTTFKCFSELILTFYQVIIFDIANTQYF